MAHALKLSGLTDQLVQSVTSYDPVKNARAFKTYKDAALKSLKIHRYGRTNQYLVKSTLNGLIEKFQVLNNEPLADALESRLDSLEKHSYKWSPECLSLLLSLSDRPLEKTDLSKSNKTEEIVQEPQLTWNDLASDDALEPSGLWDDVDFHGDSSDEDLTADSFELGESTGHTAVSENLEYQFWKPENFFATPDFKSLHEVGRVLSRRHGLEENATDVRHAVDEGLRSETESIRESLNMLLGLPSDLFRIEGASIIVASEQRLTNVSANVVTSILKSFAAIGTMMGRLRRWCSRSQSQPLIQLLQSKASRALGELEQYLADQLRRLAQPTAPGVVSIIELLTQTRSRSRNLTNLWIMLSSMHDQLRDRPYTVLQTLLARAADCQFSGDLHEYRFFLQLFIDALNSYMRPVETWMKIGVLESGNADFPVLMRHHGAGISNFWEDRYILRTQDSKVQAPDFLLPFMNDILSCGKSVAFMKELGLEDELLRDQLPKDDHFTLEKLSNSSDVIALAPITELFQAELRDWVQSRNAHLSTILKTRFSDTFGLQTTIEALGIVYLSVDGSIFNALADAILARLDARESSWTSRLGLTDLARTALCQRPSVEAAAIQLTHTDPLKANTRTVQQLACLTLKYELRAPIQNIISSSSLVIYRSCFTFLLQLRRAATLLTRTVHRSLTIPPASLLHLRHRLLFLVSTITNHLLNNVIATARLDFAKEMANASGIDDMIRAHDNFTHTLSKQCLQTKALSGIRNALLACLDLAVLFSDAWTAEMSRHAQSINQSDAMSRQAKVSQMQTQLAQLTAFIISGLRTQCREDGEASFDVLADRLDYKSTSAR